MTTASSSRKPSYAAAKAQACHDDERLFVRLEAEESPVRATLKDPLAQVCCDSCLEFFFAKGLAGGVEVGDVELKIHAQAVADEFLLIAVAGLLAAKQADDGVYFAL